GLHRLARMGLSLDALVYHHQHADLIDLARACPNASIVMNHTGMPLGYGPFAGKQSEVYAQWRSTIPQIAACPNITMKLGGMMMRLAAYDYHVLPVPPTSEELAACGAVRFRATSQSSRWGSAIGPCGTRSGVWLPAPRQRKRRRWSAAPRGGSIGSTDGFEGTPGRSQLACVGRRRARRMRCAHVRA